MEPQNNPPQTNQPAPVHSILEPDKPVTVQSSSWVKKFLLFLLVLFILLIAAAGGVYAVAYDKIEINNTDLQQQVAFIVQSLPLTPKTPKFLIAKSAMVMQKTTKFSYKSTLNLKSDAIAQGLGLKQLDLDVNGDVDYSDPRNVIANSTTYLASSPLLDLKMNGEALYFKFDTIPDSILAVVGVEKEVLAPVTNKWVVFPIEKTEQPADQPYILSKDEIKDIYNNYLDKQIVDSIKVTEKAGVYTLSMKADEKLTNHIGQMIAQNTNDATAKQYGNNLANLLKDLNIEAQIEKGTYYLRSVSISGKLAYYGSVSDASAPEIGFTLSSSFDNFGKNVTLSAPTETMSYEDFVNGLNNITAQFGLYVGGNQSAQDDTTRISDLRTIQAALELYDTDCGQYPQQLDLLVGGSYCAGKNIKYLKSVPQDPSGADYYYKLDDQGTYDLCANLSATPSADYNNCPNDSYNYHLISPRFAL